MRLFVALSCILFCICDSLGESPRVFPAGERPADSRLAELRNLNSYFPMKEAANKQDWEKRSANIRRRILISQGLWPEPTKTDLRAVVHGMLEFDDYTVERVFFESIPGHFVTGSLYRPKGKTGPFPAVLCPHGHWQDARFYDAGEANAKKSIAIGAERFMNAARNHIQARCVQLARMGCVAFFYDMTGNCDSIQIGHRPDQWKHLDKAEDWGFFGVQAELRLQNMMGLQTWNSVRAIDFLQELPDVDDKRIGVTGASGGGTQAMIIAAIDQRVTAAMPCVMVSTAMQGGCTCENAPLLRINQGNVDIAAAIAPRPLALTAADDWTVELSTKGFPELKALYTMLEKRNSLTGAFHVHFKHNYNHVNRTVAYSFFNRHFGLGLSEPILERDFELLHKEHLTVWDDAHPAPSDDAIGDVHEATILKLANDDATEKAEALIPDSKTQLAQFRSVVGGAWETILGRRLEDIDEIRFDVTMTKLIDGHKIELGKLNNIQFGEQIPTMKISHAGNTKSKGSVVWVPNTGKAEVFDGTQFHPHVKRLLDTGFDVITGDLSGQGEFLRDGKSLDAQPMWYQRDGSKGWHQFAGYTFGYNHSLFVKRTHDVLTLCKFAGAKSKVDLVGIGKTAGPIAVAARSQAGDAIERTLVDLGGFMFKNLTRCDDPMFVSGSVRYLDVDGLLSLSAPHSMIVSGLKSPIAEKVYNATSAKNELRFISDQEVADVIADWSTP